MGGGWPSRNPSDGQPEGPSRRRRLPAPPNPHPGPASPLALPSLRLLLRSPGCHVLVLHNPRRGARADAHGAGARDGWGVQACWASCPRPFLAARASILLPGPAASGLRPRGYPHPWIPERRTLLIPPRRPYGLSHPRVAFPGGRKRVRCAPLADALLLPGARRERLLSPRGSDARRWPGTYRRTKGPEQIVFGRATIYISNRSHPKAASQDRSGGSICGISGKKYTPGTEDHTSPVHCTNGSPGAPQTPGPPHPRGVGALLGTARASPGARPVGSNRTWVQPTRYLSSG